MAELGTDKRMVRIRLQGDPSVIEPLAEQMIGLLEGAGLLVLEWTRPYPCRYPEEDKSRIYISVRKEPKNESVE